MSPSSSPHPGLKVEVPAEVVSGSHVLKAPLVSTGAWPGPPTLG